MKASSKAYLSLRKELSEDERVLLKKLLRKRSDTAYKLKRSVNKADGDQHEKSKAEPIKAKVPDHDLDLNKNVKIIKGIVGEMLNIMKKTNQHNSIKSSSTVTPKTDDFIDSYLQSPSLEGASPQGGSDEDNILRKFEITINRNQ